MDHDSCGYVWCAMVRSFSSAKLWATPTPSLKYLDKTPSSWDPVEYFDRWRYVHSATQSAEILLDNHGDVVTHVLSFYTMHPGLIAGCYNCLRILEKRFNRSSPKVPRWRVARTRHVHCIDEIIQFNDFILPWSTNLMSIRIDRIQIYTLDPCKHQGNKKDSTPLLTGATRRMRIRQTRVWYLVDRYSVPWIEIPIDGDMTTEGGPILAPHPFGVSPS